MKWLELLKDQDFQFTRVSTLVTLIIGSSSVIIKVLIPFISVYYPQGLLHIAVLFIIDISIFAIWFYKRTIFPKGNKLKLNIVVAITTENKKQKIRIAKDFTREIQKQLKIHGLSDSYEVIVLHNHLSEVLSKKIDSWTDSRKAKIKDKEFEYTFNSIAKRMNAKFFVYGDLIKRNSSNSTYYLSLEALIMHAPINKISSDNLHKEFSALWKREIMFLEDDELNGFKSNANHIFFTASYMIGLATLVENNFKEGIKIWDALLNYVENNEELKEYAEKIIKLKLTCLFLLGRKLYLEGNIKESIFYREQCLEIIPDEYSRLTNQAIEQVKLNKNPELALHYIEKASVLSDGDGTWRYNKLYIQIALGHYNESIKTFDEIIKANFNNEHEVLNQTLIYNEQCLAEDSSHIQSYYIIGILIYKKLNRPLIAYENLEKFVALINDDDPLYALKKRAQKYISEINHLLEIEE